MKKMTAHSKSSLFLMEMILSVLILSLTCTACVRVLAAAKSQRQKARELNHIQELTTSAGEALEGWNGQISSFVEIFGTPGSSADSNAETDSNSAGISNTSGNIRTYLLSYYYDGEWNFCSKASALYIMTIQLSTKDSEKNADLDFYDSHKQNLYHLSITFPFEGGKDRRS